MKEIIAYPLGTKVETVLGNIEGIITEIRIVFNGVEYQVDYLDGYKIENIIMSEKEFITKDNKKVVGYLKN